jgi:hypothetical protein
MIWKVTPNSGYVEQDSANLVQGVGDNTLRFTCILHSWLFMFNIYFIISCICQNLEYRHIDFTKLLTATRVHPVTLFEREDLVCTMHPQFIYGFIYLFIYLCMHAQTTELFGET